MSKTTARARANARAIGDVPSQLGELDKLTVGELAEKYRDLVGEPTRSRNKGYLRKRVAWHLQAKAEGGLSADTLAKVAALGDALPDRWRMRQAASEPLAPRDPRLPPTGTVLTRVHQGETHEVTVRADRFEYRGEMFKSLSAIARRVTGTAWNGFAFWGCAEAKGAAA